MDIFTKKFEITFSDININNELSNRGILRLMQETAGVHSSTVGYGINDTYKTHIGWVILNWKLKVFSRPKWNSTITINTWISKITPLFIYRDLEIYDDKNNLVAIATSKWILFDVYKGSLLKVTPELREIFSNSDKSVFNDEFNEKLKEPDNSELIYEYKIQQRDIDTNHHVNNINYLDYAYEAIPKEILYNLNFTDIEIMYKHEAKIGDVISVFYCQTDENEHVITIKDKERKKLHSIIKLYN